ncbi:MAG: protein kinase [Nanoarchaeota archaeon]|nr:protein kinase [Nanoarchaeota archaeon]
MTGYPDGERKRRFIESRDGEYFAAHSVPLEVANQYYSGFSRQDIVILYRMGFTPERFSLQEQEGAFDQIISFFQFTSDRYPRVEGQDDWDNYCIIGAGKSGVLVSYRNPSSGEKTAWKFAVDVMLDYFAYEALHKFHDRPLKNVLNCRGVIKLHQVVEFEYIDGMSLEEKLKSSQGCFHIPQAVKYGHDILAGIWEMHSAGIFHRDLHDRNVIIRNEDAAAIIIDLATASKDPANMRHLNRAYGGNNDLISLGQLMYKMTTGHNLFNLGFGLTCISEAKDEIQRVRREVYDSAASIKKMLEEVRMGVIGELSDIVVFLLDDDLRVQPPLEKVEEALKMFERYRK